MKPLRALETINTDKQRAGQMKTLSDLAIALVTTRRIKFTAPPDDELAAAFRVFNVMHSGEWAKGGTLAHGFEIIPDGEAFWPSEMAELIEKEAQLLERQAKAILSYAKKGLILQAVADKLDLDANCWHLDLMIERALEDK